MCIIILYAHTRSNAIVVYTTCCVNTDWRRKRHRIGCVCYVYNIYNIYILGVYIQVSTTHCGLRYTGCHALAFHSSRTSGLSERVEQQGHFHSQSGGSTYDRPQWHTQNSFMWGKGRVLPYLKQNIIHKI